MEEQLPRRWVRFWEMVPGTLVWIGLTAPWLIAFQAPLALTILVTFLNVFYFQRALRQMVHVVRGYLRIRKTERTPWAERLEQEVPTWRDIYQCVLFPTYKEDVSVLVASIDSVLASKYPDDRLIILLATEERDAGAPERARQLEERYQGKVRAFLTTSHPAGIPGEVVGKGGNATWAARQLSKWVRENSINPAKVVVTTADADTRFPAGYFHRLTHAVCTTPHPERAAYQPVATFFNNLWDAPFFSRLLAFGTTFWQMVESVREYRLFTFSTHAMLLTTLEQMNYWAVDVVNEDSRQYARAFWHFNGRFRTVPLYLPVYMDAVAVPSLRGTLKNAFHQQLRWAYGAEHVPYMVLSALKNRRVPAWRRLTIAWRELDSSLQWSLTTYYLMFVGWLPILLNEQFNTTVPSAQFAVVTSILFWPILAWPLTCGIIASLLAPPPPKSLPRWRAYGSLFAMWVTYPVVGLPLSWIPGVTATTRLLLGRYLSFRVTDKAAVTNAA